MANGSYSNSIAVSQGTKVSNSTKVRMKRWAVGDFKKVKKKKSITDLVGTQVEV